MMYARVCIVSILAVLSSIFKGTYSVSTSTTSLPVFVTEPSDVTLVFETTTSAEAAELKCTVRSLQNNHRVSWIKNGKIISDDTTVRNDEVDQHKYKIKTPHADDGNSYDLLIYPIRATSAEADMGEYKCTVMEDGSDVTVIAESRTAVLKIYVTPRADYPMCLLNGTVSSSLTNITVIEGQSATLSCKSDKGVPNVKLQWYRNNKTLSDTLEEVDWTENSLYSEYEWTFRRNDTGVQFQCQMQHPGFSVEGYSRSNTSCMVGPFEVDFRPDVSIEPKYIEIHNENDTLTLMCNASGNPPPTKKRWTYDGDVVGNFSENFLLSDDGNSLTVIGFEDSDRGYHNVTCIVENSVGIGIATSKVNVIIPIDFTSSSILDSASSVTTIKGEDTDLPDDRGPPGKNVRSNTVTIIISIVVSTLIIVIVIVLIVCLLRARRKEKKSKDSELNYLNDSDVVISNDTKGNAYANSNLQFSGERTAGDGTELEARSQYECTGENTVGKNAVNVEEGIGQKDGKAPQTQQSSDTTDIASIKNVTKAKHDHREEETRKSSEFEEVKADKRSTDDFPGDTSSNDADDVTRKRNDKNDESFVSHPIGPQSDTKSSKMTSGGIQYAELDLAPGGRKQPPKKEEPVIYAQIQRNKVKTNINE